MEAGHLECRFGISHVVLGQVSRRGGQVPPCASQPDSASLSALLRLLQLHQTFQIDASRGWRAWHCFFLPPDTQPPPKVLGQLSQVGHPSFRVVSCLPH